MPEITPNHETLNCEDCNGEILITKKKKALCPKCLKEHEKDYKEFMMIG